MRVFAFILCVIVSAGCKQGDEKQASTKYTQYYRQGEALYTKHCSNCHQKNGSGLGRVYPPLAKSDYMMNNLDSVLCIIRQGKKTPVVVNGVVFNQPMPSNPLLTDLEIAEIATYIYNSWGNNAGLVDVKKVTATLNSCE